MSGLCEIDEAEERLILHYNWQQRRADTTMIGSDRSGKGIMVIPAGYDFMYGYWHPDDEVKISQGWNAVRLSRDITNDILKGGAFSKDLGLHQHPKTLMGDE